MKHLSGDNTGSYDGFLFFPISLFQPLSSQVGHCGRMQLPE
jgi:hypothetical protein